MFFFLDFFLKIKEKRLADTHHMVMFHLEGSILLLVTFAALGTGDVSNLCQPHMGLPYEFTNVMLKFSDYIKKDEGFTALI